MITSKHGYVGTRKCVKYSGTHEELRDMLKEGDIVTLLRQNDDKSHSIKITGTVLRLKEASVLIRACSEDTSIPVMCEDTRRCGNNTYEYEITSIKRFVENMLPDSPGLWKDRNGDVWIIGESALLGQLIRIDGQWHTRTVIATQSEYAEYAPFTKLTLTEASS